jgi:biopolymer transport protein ExbD
MKSSLSVSLVALALALASNFAPQATAQSPTLQQGVSVQMAVTSDASPMADADNQDAWIVVVTADGGVYFGIDRVTPSDLANRIKSRPRKGDQKLYIKADARAPFSAVRKVFAAAHEADFQTAVLLTSQPGSPTTGTMVPEGLEVLIGPHSNAAIVVQVDPGQPSPALEVNDQKIPAAALQDTLKRLLQSHSDTPVLVKTSGLVAFGPIAHVIDTCHSIGAKVMLSTPLL